MVKLPLQGRGTNLKPAETKGRRGRAEDTPGSSALAVTLRRPDRFRPLRAAGTEKADRTAFAAVPETE